MSANERILVVDDDDDIREILQYVLGEEGYRVDVASDGFDALGKLENGAPPAVILLDMMMPHMDGATFLRVLRSKPAFAGARVVVISGNATARETARQLSAVACLVKPFETEELLGLVRRYAREAGD